MFWRALAVFVCTAAVFLLPAHSIGNQPQLKSPQQQTYSIRTAVIGAAGAPAQASGFTQRGTLAQSTPIGVGEGPDHTVYAGFWKAWAETPTGVEDEPVVYTDRLYQNYPNPFNPTTTIAYSVAQTSPVVIAIYNVKGQRVRQLVNETRPAGRHTVAWDGTSEGGQPVASGVYFYRIRIGGFTDVKKMVFLK